MHDRTRNIIVGITALAGIVGFAFLLTLFGWLPTIVESGYTVNIHLPNAGGLVTGSRVKLTGIDIGYITSVDFRPPPARGIVAVALIREHIAIPKDASVLVEQPLLTGSPWIAVEASTLTEAQLQQPLPTDGSATVEGRTPTLAEKLTAGLQSSIEGELGGPLQNLSNIQKSFDRLSSEWTQVGVNVNAMISRDDAGREGDLLALVSRTAKRLEDVEKTLAEANKMFASVGKASTDIGDAATTMKETSTQFRTLATDTNKRIAALTETAQKRLDELTRRYITLADDMATLTAATTAAVNKAQSPDGTLGKLMTDPALYDNLNDASIRIGQALDEVTMLIEKWKNEGIPVNF